MFDSKKLKAQMTLKGVTQEQLAEKLELNATTINMKVNCKREWTLSELLKMVDIFGKNAVISIFFE